MSNTLYDYYFKEIVTKGRCGSLSDLTKVKLFNYAFNKTHEQSIDETRNMYEELQDMVEDILEDELDAREPDLINWLKENEI